MGLEFRDLGFGQFIWDLGFGQFILFLLISFKTFQYFNLHFGSLTHCFTNLFQLFRIFYLLFFGID